jgi:hypothetical protein
MFSYNDHCAHMSMRLSSPHSSLTPLAPRDSLVTDIIDDFQPPYYDYLLGDDILVSPVVANSTTNVTASKVGLIADCCF